MNVLTIILTIIYVIIGIGISVTVLMQEGNTEGLGTIGGMADSYWGKNKSRSLEGNLEKLTKFATIAFMVLALILNIIM